MALDREYFDSISIELVKKKYYNAGKVTALLDEIKQHAGKLNEENAALRQELETLRAKLAELEKQKAEIGETVMSARTLYQNTVEKAKAEADRIIAQAQDERRKLEAEKAQCQEYSVKRMERCISRLKEQQQSTIELINAEWQDFLCGLESDGAAPEERDTPPAELPADLGEKLDDISRQIRSIDEEE